MSRYSECRQITLCELLDRLIDKGIVLSGEAIISVADVDLILLGLRLVITSVEKTHELSDRPNENSALSGGRTVK